MRGPSESALKRVQIIGFSFVLVLVPFIIYYYFCVSNQTKYFTGRDLRVLGALSTHVQESVESQSTIFTNAVARYLAELPKIVSEESFSEEKIDTGTIIKSLKVKNPVFQQWFQGRLNTLKGEGTNLTITNLEVVSKPSNDASPATPKMEIKQEENQRWLYLHHTTVYPPPHPTYAVNGLSPDDQSTEGKGAEPVYLEFTVKTDLAELIGPFVNKSQSEETRGSFNEGGFDATLLADIDEDTNVIFQDSSTELRLASLNNLTKVADGATVDMKLLSQSTNVVDVRVAGRDYKLFSQPMQLHLAKQGSEKKQGVRWLACGLVDSAHFREESLSVPYTILIVFGFITVFVALTWPFLKLFFSGPKDRFRRIDAYLLVVSTVLITALLTLFASYAHSYLATELRMDGELEAFAGAIQKNFKNELGSALQEIDQLNCNPQLLETSGFRRPENCNRISPASNQVTAAEGDPTKTLTPLEPDRARIVNRELQQQPNSYPYFVSAFWVDRSGRQRIKWTVRQTLTNNVLLSDRPYVYKLIQGQHYTFTDNNNEQHKFYLQPVVSRTTGQNEVIISKPIFPQTDDRMWISAINTRLLSLMQPVVPSGFGFAVIDDTGKVLFHSDEKHLGENFLEECDNDQTLRAVILGRSGQQIAGSYLGKGHTMYAQPMGYFSWTVVAFRSKDYLRTTFCEILTLCLLLFFSYLVCLLVLILTLYLIDRAARHRFLWLWPDHNKTKVYLWLIGLNAVLVFLSASSIRWLPGLWKIGVPITISILAVLLFGLILKRANASAVTDESTAKESTAQPTVRNFLNHRLAYTLNATLMFALVSMIPAYACFKLAYVEEMKLFIKEGQLNLARSLADRKDRVRAQYLWTDPAGKIDPAMEKFVETRLSNRDYDVYNQFFFKTELQGASVSHQEYVTPSENRLMKFFKKFVPLFNQSSTERHALMWPAADHSWQWEERLPTELVLHVTGALTRTQSVSESHIVSKFPVLGGSSWWSMWPVLLALVSLIVGYMFRQVFLFMREETPKDKLRRFCEDSVSQNLFLVLNPPFFGKRELFDRLGLGAGKLERLDVRQREVVETWMKKPESEQTTDSPEQPKSNGHPLILDNFDFEIPNASEQRLSLLEKLRGLKRVAIAISTLDPDRFLPGENGAPGSENASLISERWTSVVSRFLRITLEDVGNPEAFDRKLTERKQELLKDEKLTPGVKEQIECVFATIKRECLPRASLQSIGEGIASQPDITTQSPSDITTQVLMQAMAYYQSIWRVCSDDEKFTLSRLAKYGLLSSSDPDIETLMKKGLIVRDPALNLMNESFRSFVLTVGHGQALAECEAKAKQSSSWEVLKVPLTIVLSSVIIFMFLTQREIYNSALPIITALTAGVPSFFKAVSLFHGDSGGKAGG